MKKNIFSRFAVIAVAALTLCLAGCNQPKDLTLSTLEGKWVSSYNEEFNITPDTFDNGSYSYAGEELTIVEDEETEGSGIIFIKYTRASCPTHSNYEKKIYAYDGDAPDVGKWYAVHYKNLTSESVELAGAYKFGGKTSTTTLEEAKNEFTLANGYFEFHSECKKAE